MDHLNAQVVLTLFPGMNDLSLGMAGEVGGSQWDSQINAFRLLQGDFTSPGFFQVSRQGRGVRFGDTQSELLGSSQGLRLFVPWRGEGNSVGLGLYHRLRGGGGGTSGLLPAADAEWRLRKGWDGGLLVAADASWRLTQRAAGGNWQLSGFAGHDVHTERMEGGLLYERKVTRASSLRARVFGLTGDRPFNSTSLGLIHRLGRGLVSLDQTLSNRSGESNARTSIGVYVPYRQHALALRWDREVESGQRADRTSQNLLASLYSSLDSRTTVWGNVETRMEERGSPETQLGLGVARALGSRWDLRAEVRQRLGEWDPSLRVGVGYRLSPEWHLRLLVGPGPSDGDYGNRPAAGVQITRILNFRSSYGGRVSGRVLVDGKPCAERLRIEIDDRGVVETNDRGEFRVRELLPGSHRIALHVPSIPADLLADTTEHQVEIRSRKNTEVVFSLKRVGQVRGTVAVGADQFGHTDPTAGVGITISAGEDNQTTTNGAGEFALGGLTQGRHRVALLASTIPPDFEVVGPAEVEVEVHPDRPATIQFQIRPRPKKVEFAPEASTPAPAQPSPGAAPQNE